MSKLLGAMAFYKADTPNGIIIKQIEGSDLHKFKRNVEDLQKKKIEDPGVMLALLKEFGERGPGLPSDVLLRLFVVIAWLEGQGFIDTDEYNGIVWIEEPVMHIPVKRKAWRFVD